MAEVEEGDDPGATWNVGLTKVERLDPDEPDDEEHFAVEFELSGPATNASATAMVFDPTDEADIVGTARDALRDGLKRWLQVLECRAAAKPVGPTEG